ncbi:MAG: GGDEF domain-containing protein [Pseudomonadota bacterium]
MKRSSVPTSAEEKLAAYGIDIAKIDAALSERLVHLASELQDLEHSFRALREELKTVRALADHDPLCPVFNRRAFRRELRREIAMADRHGTGLSVLYIDLDGFKAINDARGHDAGDQVLQAVAATLVAGVRQTDIVARLGGDEFGVIFVRVDTGSVAARVQDLRAALDKKIAGPYGVTASIGVAHWSEALEADDLITAADADMFRRKSEAAAKS